MVWDLEQIRALARYKMDFVTEGADGQERALSAPRSLLCMPWCLLYISAGFGVAAVAAYHFRIAV